MKHLDDIEARIKAATPGPWEARQGAVAPGKKVVGPRSADDIGKGSVTLMQPIFWDHRSAANADLIAHAPDDLTRTTNALRAVLELHKPVMEDGVSVGCLCCDWDQGGNEEYPCATIRAITEALQGEQ